MNLIIKVVKNYHQLSTTFKLNHQKLLFSKINKNHVLNNVIIIQMKWHKLFEINLFSTPIIQLLDSSTVDFSPSAID